MDRKKWNAKNDFGILCRSSMLSSKQKHCSLKSKQKNFRKTLLGNLSEIF